MSDELPRVGDKITILRHRNFNGTEVDSYTTTPFKIGDTFVVGRIEDVGYPCKVAFPAGDDSGFFWRMDDLSVVAEADGNKPS